MLDIDFTGPADGRKSLGLHLISTIILGWYCQIEARQVFIKTSLKILLVKKENQVHCIRQKLKSRIRCNTKRVLGHLRSF